MSIKRLFIILLTLVVLPLQIVAIELPQPDPTPESKVIESIEDAIENILTAFSNGNASLIDRNLNNSVEITTPTGEGVYSKAQAIKILQRFFTQNKSDKCEVIHKGSSNSGSQFVVLSYSTSKEDFRITLFLKQINSEVLIQEIEIVKQL